MLAALSVRTGIDQTINLGWPESMSLPSLPAPFTQPTLRILIGPHAHATSIASLELFLDTCLVLRPEYIYLVIHHTALTDDALGQVTRHVHPGHPGQTTWTYRGNQLCVWDSDHGTEIAALQYISDPFGNPIWRITLPADHLRTPLLSRLPFTHPSPVDLTIVDSCSPKYFRKHRRLLFAQLFRVLESSTLTKIALPGDLLLSDSKKREKIFSLLQQQDTLRELQLSIGSSPCKQRIPEYLDISRMVDTTLNLLPRLHKLTIPDLLVPANILMHRRRHPTLAVVLLSQGFIHS